jgi:hypothetical protein
MAASLGVSPLKKNRVSWMGAAVQTKLEHGSRQIAIVGAVTRQLLVKTLQNGKELGCALVICKVWRSAMALQLSVVTSRELRRSINPISNPKLHRESL